MKRKLTICLMLFIVSAIGIETATAQFNIKIPKINKPKTEQPKTDAPNPNGDDSSQNSPKKSGNAPAHMPKPKPNSVPVLLKDTFEIKTHRGNRRGKPKRFTAIR